MKDETKKEGFPRNNSQAMRSQGYMIQPFGPTTTTPKEKTRKKNNALGPKNRCSNILLCVAQRNQGYFYH